MKISEKDLLELWKRNHGHFRRTGEATGKIEARLHNFLAFCEDLRRVAIGELSVEAIDPTDLKAMTRRLGELEDNQASDRVIDKAVDALIVALKAHLNLPDAALVLGLHECETSPTGECVYDEDEDPAHDDCIFCHAPYERK